MNQSYQIQTNSRFINQQMTSDTKIVLMYIKLYSHLHLVENLEYVKILSVRDFVTNCNEFKLYPEHPSRANLRNKIVNFLDHCIRLFIFLHGYFIIIVKCFLVSFIQIDVHDLLLNLIYFAVTIQMSLPWW